MHESFEVIELDPQKRSCHILCVSPTRGDADRIVAALLLSDPGAEFHINQRPSTPKRKRIREKGAFN